MEAHLVFAHQAIEDCVLRKIKQEKVNSHHLSVSFVAPNTNDELLKFTQSQPCNMSNGVLHQEVTDFSIVALKRSQNSSQPEHSLLTLLPTLVWTDQRIQFFGGQSHCCIAPENIMNSRCENKGPGHWGQTIGESLDVRNSAPRMPNKCKVLNAKKEEWNMTWSLYWPGISISRLEKRIKYGLSTSSFSCVRPRTLFCKCVFHLFSRKINSVSD